MQYFVSTTQKEDTDHEYARGTCKTLQLTAPSASPAHCCRTPHPQQQQPLWKRPHLVEHTLGPCHPTQAGPSFNRAPFQFKSSGYVPFSPSCVFCARDEKNHVHSIRLGALTVLTSIYYQASTRSHRNSTGFRANASCKLPYRISITPCYWISVSSESSRQQ